MGLLKQAEALAEMAPKKHVHAGMVAYGLSELREHLKMVAADPVKMWPEFAQLYCLMPDDLERATKP